MFDLFKRAPTDERRSWGERLRAGLEASRQRIAQPLAALMGRKELSEEALGALETALLSADVGVATTERLLADLRSRWPRAGANVDPRALLKASLAGLLAPLEKPFVVGPERPFVIMLAGVNGAGKTTSIGKLARSLQMQGRSVLLAAGDTFRAAAREQLQAWGERNRVQVIAQQGGDPAAVMFGTIGARQAPRPEFLGIDGHDERGFYLAVLLVALATTLLVVATNAKLSKERAHLLSLAAHDGIAGAIRPAHTMWDGDTAFVLATGPVEAEHRTLESLAEEAVKEAIRRAVLLADSVPGFPSAKEGRLA